VVCVEKGDVLDGRGTRRDRTGGVKQRGALSQSVNGKEGTRSVVGNGGLKGLTKKP